MPASRHPIAVKQADVQFLIFERVRHPGPTPELRARWPRRCSARNRNSSSLRMPTGVSRELQPGCFLRCPCRQLLKNLDTISPAGVSCALSSNTSAFVNELLDVTGVESQRASAGPHLDGRQVWLPLTGGVLNDP